MYRARLSENSQHVALAHDEIFLAFEFDFCSAILTIEHRIAGFQDHFFVFRSVAHGKHTALQGFLLGCIGNDDTTYCFLFCGRRLDKHSVGQWFDVHNFYV